jgi:hypothetical protein
MNPLNVVAARNRLEDRRRRRTEQRRIAEQPDERREVGVRCRRPALNLAALELAPPPVTVASGNAWRLLLTLRSPREGVIALNLPRVVARFVDASNAR